MQDFSTMNLDSMMRDIIDIFNLEGVELVRLSGLHKRALRISNYHALDREVLNRIIYKLKRQGLIKYQYILQCPYCNEISYQITDRDVSSAKICDTCKSIYIPTKDVSLFYDNIDSFRCSRL